MPLLYWIIVAAVWALIPAVLVMKAVMDIRQEKFERECWDKVAELLAQARERGR
jgi:uncharacterized membrane protein YjjB (DUF3815 family)